MLSFLVDELRLAGGGITRLAQGSAAPITVDDAVSVTRGTGAVTIPVLANDADPEGQLLTLVSAFAALGMAVAEADNTVTYTPPASPTVICEVAYVEDARDTGQIGIAISDPVVDLTALPDQHLEVTAYTFPIDAAAALYLMTTDPGMRLYTGRWLIAS